MNYFEQIHILLMLMVQAISYLFFYENKRYAVVDKITNNLIGMVGMGLEDTLNEVEMAYFIDENCRGNGYAVEALNALFDWCISVSDIKYMILTIDCANKASCRVAEKAGFELFENGV